MDKNILEKLITEGKTIAKMAEELNVSITTLKKYLNRYGLKTVRFRSNNVGMPCKICKKTLTGRQQSFCSNKCRCNYNNHHVNDGEGNKTYYVQKEKGYVIKREFIEMKGGGCMICGYKKSLRALTFHHRDPSTKEFVLDVRHLSNRSYSKCLAEMEKCDLLCFNCHMELHEKELVVPVVIETTSGSYKPPAITSQLRDN
jgi:hypothetical protein